MAFGQGQVRHCVNGLWAGSGQALCEWPLGRVRSGIV